MISTEAVKSHGMAWKDTELGERGHSDDVGCYGSSGSSRIRAGIIE